LRILNATGQDIVQNVKGTVADVKAVWEGVEIDPGPASDAIAAPVEFAEKKIKDAGKRIVDEAQKIWERVEASIARIRRDVATFGMADTQVQLFDLRAAGASPEQLERARELLTQLDLLKQRQKQGEDAARAA